MKIVNFANFIASSIKLCKQIIMLKAEVSYILNFNFNVTF